MLQKFRTWYQNKKDYLPTICFLCGSTWDILTLRRIDSTIDLTIFCGYLFLSSVIVVLIARNATFKFSQYLPAAAQFFFGGMLSGTTVYYFKSTSSFPAFLFLLCLASLLVGNEYLEKKYSNAQVSYTLWSICAAMIFNFLLPVIFKRMESWVFISAITIAASICFFIRWIVSSKVSFKPVAVLYSTLIILYFLNVIPPVPISTKHLGIFHSIKRSNNEYTCYKEKKSLWRGLSKNGEKNFTYTPGDTIFCFSSIFAPTRLKKKINHHWYYKDQKSGKYQEIAKIGYKLTGGRNEGYRGYTYVKNIRPGAWKVKLKTDDGKTIGIETFKTTLRAKADPPQMQTITF